MRNVTAGIHQITAREVRLSDKVIIVDKQTNHITFHDVKDIWSTTESGVFAPLIRDAYLIVNNFAVSVYAFPDGESNRPYPFSRNWETKHRLLTYDRLFWPVYIFYNIFGATITEWYAEVTGMHRAIFLMLLVKYIYSVVIFLPLSVFLGVLIYLAASFFSSSKRTIVRKGASNAKSEKME